MTLEAPQRTRELRDWATIASLCKKCSLCESRNRVVFGVGPVGAKLMLVGEAPGQHEDEKGLPFVGRSGDLLTKMLRGIGVRRKDVYVTNVLKCRPPDNRTPEQDEIDSCREYLQRQIEIVSPAILVALGATAMRCLTQKRAAISSVRGEFIDYEGIPVLSTYHPAYLLRDPRKKTEAWEDLQTLRAKLDELAKQSAD